MDSALSELREALAYLRESVSREDWTNVESVAASIRHGALPSSQEGLGEYLRELKAALIAARTWRANAMASSVRLNAAVRFQEAGAEMPRARQNSAVSTGF